MMFTTNGMPGMQWIVLAGTVVMALLGLAGWLVYRLASHSRRVEPRGQAERVDRLAVQFAAGSIDAEEYQAATAARPTEPRRSAGRPAGTILALVATVAALVMVIGASAVSMSTASTYGSRTGFTMGNGSSWGRVSMMGRSNSEAAAAALNSCQAARTDGNQAVFTAHGMVMSMGMGRAFFTPTTSTTSAGKVTVTLVNAGGQPHELVVLPLAAGQTAGHRAAGSDDTVSEEGSLGEVHPVCPSPSPEGDTPAGGVSQATLELAPGTYEIVCNLPGHYRIGMYATLIVR